jgi:flagellar protein FliO/FliZ
MAFPIEQVATAAGALGAVLALVWLAGRAARLGGMRRAVGGSRLAVQDTVALDRVRRLVLVRCDGRELLLLTGGGSDQVVGWLPGAGS